MKSPHRASRDEVTELCLQTLATGTVQGVSPNHDPDLLTRDSSFTQSANGLMLQTHRLAEPPKWTALRAELERYGYALQLGPFTHKHQEHHVVVAANTGAIVFAVGCRGRAAATGQGCGLTGVEPPMVVVLTPRPEGSTT